MSQTPDGLKIYSFSGAGLLVLASEHNKAIAALEQQNADLCVKNAELQEAMHNIVKADKTKYDYSGSPHARNPAGDLPAIGRRWATPAEMAKEAIAKAGK